MINQSWMSGGKGRAVAGGVVALVLVVMGLVFSGSLFQPEVPQSGQTGQSGQDQPATAPVTATAPEAPATAPEPAPEPVTEAAPEAEPATTAAATTEAPATTQAPAEAPADTAVSATTAPETAATDTTASDAAAADTTDPATTAAETTASDTAALTPLPESPVLRMPSFDTVRLAPDGEALVAGRAAPGDTVDILLDGVVVGDAMVGGDGAFAAFLSLQTSDAPRIMTLAVGQGADRILSEQQVIIAPVAGVASTAVAAASGAAGTPTADAGASAPAASSAQPGAAAPALLLADGNGVRVLQPATPVDPSSGGAGLAIDVISYTADGDVLLQGRGRPEATILVYLDNAVITSAPVTADGVWSTGLPGVAPGIYTLRLDEVDAAGRVLARIETPFKREDRDEVAAIAAAGSPATGAAGSDTGVVAQPETAAVASGTPQPADSTTAPAVRVVTVQPGNTLWAIARESYGEGLLFVRLFEANRERIRDPDLIYPGQVFTIPE